MNPELRRNLWLEITVHRLVGMPLLLGLLFLALGAIDHKAPGNFVSWGALAGFALLTVLWGTRLSANSVTDELTEKTWDWQRLSALDPWTMTWGKLFGSTVFAWYGGLLCLLVYLFAGGGESLANSLRLVGCVAFAALTMHGAAIASTLHTARIGVPSRRRSLGTLLALLLVLVNTSSMLLTRNWNEQHRIVWYGNDYQALDFLFCSAAAFAGWAVLGAYRSMCQSLMVRTTPWVWLLFLLFLTGYAGGFSDGSSWPVAMVGLVWGLLMTYLMLFTELTGPVVLRRIALKVRRGEWRSALEDLPCWPVAWLFSLLCAALLSWQGAHTEFAAWKELPFAPLVFALLAARDAGILLFFLASSQVKRAIGAAIIYVAVLSWILPGLLKVSGLDLLSQLVLPVGAGNALLQCLVALAQAAVVAFLVWKRVSKSVGR